MGAGIVEEFAIKGYTMDDERLKSGGSILTELQNKLLH
ncbi:virulence RhuM family protein [Castellaniella caeni]|nr:virulence RhuM family protein [Castellaniella caeni]